MKNTFKLFLALFLVSLAINAGMAQPNPTYTLTATNFQLISINNPDDALTFDVYLRWTNSATSQPFEYSSGQYFLTFNRNVMTDNGNPIVFPANPNDTSKYSYKIIGSTFPTAAIPRNPSFQNTTSNPAIPPDQAVLRLATNATLGCGSGPLVLSSFPGTMVVRMRLWNKQGTFNTQALNIAWRNPDPAVDLVTRVLFYASDPFCMNTDITTPQTHQVDNNLGTLPVELASFTSLINRNNVTLNWSTATETNNQGFDVERKLVAGTEWSKAGTVEGKGTSTDVTNYTFTERAETGTYNYRLKQIDVNGNFEYFQLSNEVTVGVPSEYNMTQNYPNPFNPTTKIDYDLPYDGKVSILLYDISGREVANLVNEVKTAGYHSIQFNGANLASGMYFYRIIAQGNNNNFTQTKKMVLIK